MKNKNQDENKIEIAKRIADHSQRVAKTYESFEEHFFRFIRMFSNALDRFMFNPKYGAAVALVLAMLLYATINLSDLGALFKAQVENSHTFTEVPVFVDYNSDKWEISGIDDNCEVTIIGDQTTITTQQNSTGYRVVANLNNLTAGTHTVKLVAEKFINGLRVNINPTNVTVNIKEKITQNRDISFDFINTDKMDSIYVLGTPEFEMTKVAVRASESTLNSVALVKALIDVSDMSSDFEQHAKLVAYDQNGNIVKADIKPETIKVNVKVTSPNKQVSVVVEPVGEIPNGMAIETITMDHNSITVYAPETVLSKLDKVTIAFDATTLTKDSENYYGTINMPTGVKALSVSKVNMDIKLGVQVSKIIENVPLNYINNTQNLQASVDPTMISVEVIGTQANIDLIEAKDIYAYIDLLNVNVDETQEVDVFIRTKNEMFVRFNSLTPKVKIKFIGENTNTDTEGGN